MNKHTTDIVSYLTWVGLIIAFIMGDRYASRFHLNQALVIWLAFTVLGLVARFVPLVGGVIGGVGSLFCALCWFIGLIGAIQGTERPVPLLGQIRLL